MRLAKDQVQDEQTVTADVRKEVIETDTDGSGTYASGTRTTADDDLR